MEADRPGRLFIGGLTREANEKMLKAVFGRHGPLSEVLLLKYQSGKCRGFAFVAFENCADAEHATRDLNGKFLDGKAIKVEQAKKPFFQSAGRQRTLRFSGKRRPTGKQRSARGRSGQTRGWHLSRRARLDDGEHTGDLNMSFFLEDLPFPVKRCPTLRSGGPYPKMSAPFTVARSNSRIGSQGPTSRGRENYGGPSCGKSVSSWRHEHMSRKDDGYVPKNSNGLRIVPKPFLCSKLQVPHQVIVMHIFLFEYSDHDGYKTHADFTSHGRENYGGPSCGKLVSSWRHDDTSQKDDGYAPKNRNNPGFRDTKDYVLMCRHYAYREHAHSRQDTHSTRGCSDHDGNRRHAGRDRSEHRGRSSNRDSYQTYRTSHSAASAQMPRKIYGGSSCPDYNNTRDRYGRSQEKYSRSHGDFSSSHHENCGRKETVCPPSVESVDCASPEAHGTSRYGTSTGNDIGRRSEKGD
ncbi:RNA-binding motif protein, X chromosome-like [Saimiri boliviensis]|uniref:RNA-binding motif protein, X chromosome-like n=1 Tax=Saimiri boliviensis TaxID=27679 RepID=UPI003D78A134